MQVWWTVTPPRAVKASSLCQGVPPRINWRDGEREHSLHAPKDGDLLIARLKSAETLMAGRNAPDVQIGRMSCVKRRKTHRTV